jgi:hypothetical protein
MAFRNQGSVDTYVFFLRVPPSLGKIFNESIVPEDLFRLQLRKIRIMRGSGNAYYAVISKSVSPAVPYRCALPSHSSQKL